MRGKYIEMEGNKEVRKEEGKNGQFREMEEEGSKGWRAKDEDRGKVIEE